MFGARKDEGGENEFSRSPLTLTRQSAATDAVAVATIIAIDAAFPRVVMGMC